MRLIGSLPTESDANRIGDYLVSVGINNHVEAGNDGSWLLWIDHDDHVEQGQLQLRAYQANPNDPRYANASTTARALRVEAERLAVRRQRNFTDVRTRWPGGRARRTPVAMLCIALCVVVAFLTKLNVSEERSPVTEALVFQPLTAVFRESRNDPDDVVFDGAKYHVATMFSSIGSGQVWRLITPIFLHFGPIHLLFNMSWLYTLGFAIERRHGSLFFLLLVLGSAVFSNCTEALWAVYGFFNPIGYSSGGGFSGVNYALFGYAFLKGRLQPYEGLAVPQQTVGLMIAWLFICMTGMVGPVANAAHVGGFVAGAFAGAWPTLKRKITP